MKLNELYEQVAKRDKKKEAKLLDKATVFFFSFSLCRFIFPLSLSADLLEHLERKCPKQGGENSRLKVSEWIEFQLKLPKIRGRIFEIQVP